MILLAYWLKIVTLMVFIIKSIKFFEEIAVPDEPNRGVHRTRVCGIIPKIFMAIFQFLVALVSLPFVLLLVIGWPAVLYYVEGRPRKRLITVALFFLGVVIIPITLLIGVGILIVLLIEGGRLILDECGCRKNRLVGLL